MWESRLAKCANSVLTCLRLNFNRFERWWGGNLRTGIWGGSKKATHCNKSPLSLTLKDSAGPRIWGSVCSSIIWRRTKVFTLQLWQLEVHLLIWVRLDKGPNQHKAGTQTLNARAEPTNLSCVCAYPYLAVFGTEDSAGVDLLIYSNLFYDVC